MLYDQNSLVIVGGLLVLILVANELGYRVGVRALRVADADLKSQTNAIQAGMLGLLALLLGFTFNMALQRFDSRTDAVTREANAIGTTVLRSELLPDSHRVAASELLSTYVAHRVATSSLDATRVQQRQEVADEINALQRELWAEAVRAVADDPNPVTTGLYVQALNEMIDARGARNALLNKHVPEVVLFLLFAVFIAAGGMLGYASGGGRRPLVATVLMNVLVVMVVFIVVDLDRPKRGIIQVDQSALHELGRAM